MVAKDVANRAAGPATEGAPTRAERSVVLLRPLTTYAASRLLMLLVALATIATHARLTWQRAVSAWDGGWYISVARHGYPHTVPTVHRRAIPSNIGFFPLFPLAMRAVHGPTGLSYTVSGLIVTAVFGAAFVVLVWWLLQQAFNASVADRATALICFFPGFFAFGLLYSEPMSLALTALCVVALLRRWWLAAGLAAGLASAARPNAAVLVLVCAWAAGVAIWRRREWMALLAPLLAPVGILAQFTFLYFRTGQFLSYERVQEQGWHLGIRPLEPLRLAKLFLERPFQQWDVTLAAFGAAFIVVSAVLLLRSDFPRVLVVYGLAVGALDLFVVPTPRFVLTAFPLVAVVGRRLKGGWYWVALTGCGMGLAGVLVLTLLGKTTP